MEKSERASRARRHLDARRGKIALLKDAATRPPRGWIKALREALGMSSAQLASRMGVSQPRVVLMEQSEIRGRIKLETLQRVAAALNCQLVYALVPNQPLEDMVDARAKEIAARHLGAVEHTMRLEAQGVSGDEARRWQLEDVARQIKTRDLWNGY